MPKYKESEFIELLIELGCEFDGEEIGTSQIWSLDGSFVFIVPKAVDGWFDSEIMDELLANRWIPKPKDGPEKYAD